MNNYSPVDTTGQSEVLLSYPVKPNNNSHHSAAGDMGSADKPLDELHVVHNGNANGGGNVNAGENSLPHNSSCTDTTQFFQTRTYGRRWVILILFVFYSMSNAFQWIQYSIIADVVQKYYDVTPEVIDWTSMVYMVTYIPLIFPASWLLNLKGLRYAVLIGSFGTMLGAWIKCGSVAQDRFWLTMVGQSVCAVSQIFILGIPPRLAAVWFGPTEVSTACAIGVFGNQLGVALGFLLPPELVRDGPIDEIAHGFNVMFFTTAGACTILFILVIIIFKAEPPMPPSPAAAASEQDNYKESIKRLMTNKSYCLLLLSYGINVGVFYAISVHLNQVYLGYFAGQGQNAGRVGLLIVLSGMVGSVVCGLWLDKTHKFKQTTMAIYVFALIGMVAYTFVFTAYQEWLVFVVASFLGFFMTGYLPVGFEFAAEITYPESEGTSSGLLNASAQVFGILFTSVAGKVLHSYGDLYSNGGLAGTLVVGMLMTALVKADLRRQRAQQTPTLSKTDGVLCP